MSRAATLMVQGTASHAGKSSLAAALCRLAWRAGLRVAPFKAQNLSLNAVVASGVLAGEAAGEIGWAQAVQAAACGVAPTVDMNPILLKPTAGGCQLVLRGRALATLGAGEPRRYPPEVEAAARAALERLRAAHDLVVLEGAGSPAELNLLDRDFANRWAAEAADAPILVVGDISRGGVFASLYGTWALSPHAGRIRGFIINKLHGGGAGLAPGLRELEQRTGVPTLGVIPWRDPELPEEDSAALDARSLPGSGPRSGTGTLRVGVVRLPHISNFTDFDELARLPGVALFYGWRREELESADVLILPGSKSTVSDLEALRAQRLDQLLGRAATAGKPILGICGGYQMMGQEIRDPAGVESGPGVVTGLGLLPVVTEFQLAKRTEWVQVTDAEGATLRGYCIHAGRCQRLGGEPLFQQEDGYPEGCKVGRLMGTAVHGAITPKWVGWWRKWAGLEDLPAAPGAFPSLDQRLDGWADHVRAHLDWERVQLLMRGAK